MRKWHRVPQWIINENENDIMTHKIIAILNKWIIIMKNAHASSLTLKAVSEYITMSLDK